MPPSVAVVTDSTAYLPPVEGITVVPLTVVAGGVSYDEPDYTGDLAAATTSQPSPDRFAAVYATLAEAGHTGVVSVHLSSALSGTAGAAALAGASAALPVEVVDSRSLAMGLGYPVLAAAREAARGAGLTAVAAAARTCAAATRTFFCVDTLDQLRRSGRVSTTASIFGSALMIKPLLHISGGTIQPLEKVRTAARAVARMEDLAVEAAGSAPVDVAVQHVGAPERAQALAERIKGRLPAVRELRVVEAGAVVGAHVGPGMVGITVAPGSH
ncbi:DegV family protein [Nonomuraea typhae]|uniref:DegV family protein n=1 Tax=Nonomuraea typhae TaxID=2603600 RepID=UPI0012FAB8F2|nr:DegV family protein [Nonomuraea typhae]